MIIGTFVPRIIKMKKVILIIMDGWGHGTKPAADAIYQANTPFVKGLYQKYPNTTLKTDGEAVGLPDGQMGNSEVGHLNIGAGRIVYQELLRINQAIQNSELQKNKVLLDAFKYAKDNNKPLHFIGLVSNGGVHSSNEHLKALCNMTKANGLSKVYIHAFTDGRDTDPKSGIGFLDDLQNHLKKSVGEIASVVGRYYAMDRDNRWQRIKLAYDLLTKGIGEPTKDIHSAVTKSYEAGVTDEFIKPIVKVKEDNTPLATIQNGDAVICFNFRTDRCRQITKALTQQDFPEFEMKKFDLYYVTMTIFDHSFKNVKNVFNNQDLSMTLGEVLQNKGLKQIRISETEKYPHVTFFFSGGREKPFDGETRILIPSPKVATYDLQPEMSAIPVKDAIVKELNNKSADFICLNFANADMVGHTGVFSAVEKAVTTVDVCVNEVVEAALKNDYAVFLTADHGNAEFKINDDGSPNTAHTKNPVPLFFIDNDMKPKLKSGKLADIAPTILKIMGIDIPTQMDGTILI
jgi:2,3-bisphosphoglycerate-independent phosphoglycerate mutase